MDKLVRDGKVAVIYSPKYGAGWSTWNTGHPSMVLDRELAEAILSGPRELRHEVASRKWPDAYRGGLDDCEIEWVPEGTAFKINEYDGNESVVIMGVVDWLIA